MLLSSSGNKIRMWRMISRLALRGGFRLGCWLSLPGKWMLSTLLILSCFPVFSGLLANVDGKDKDGGCSVSGPISPPLRNQGRRVQAQGQSLRQQPSPRKPRRKRRCKKQQQPSLYVKVLRKNFRQKVAKVNDW